MNPEKKPGSDRKFPRRENAQGEHQGVAHSPDEFDVMNPAKLKHQPADRPQDD